MAPRLLVGMPVRAVLRGPEVIPAGYTPSYINRNNPNLAGLRAFAYSTEQRQPYGLFNGYHAPRHLSPYGSPPMLARQNIGLPVSTPRYAGVMLNTPPSSTGS